MKTIAIGDIHGRYHTFKKMLHTLERYGLEDSNLVLLGDYIDRGPYSKQVIDLIMELQDTFPNTITPLKGNHEDMCEKHYHWQEYPDNEAWQAKRFGDAFLYNGGTYTCASFHLAKRTTFPDGIDSQDVHRIPKEYVDWMRNLPVKHEDEHGYYVHAGFRPLVPADGQDEDDMLWIRQEFLYGAKAWPKKVVHGHTPGPFHVDERRIGIDMGAGYGEQLCAVVLGGDEPVSVIIDVLEEDKFDVLRDECIKPI